MDLKVRLPSASRTASRFFSLVCAWRWWLQGPGGNPWVFILATALLVSVSWPEFLAAEPDQNLTWSQHRPFVPEKYDYAFQLGGAWEEHSLYWMGAQVGRHLGTCILSESQTCQQYADLIAGVSGREGQTLGLLLGGLRWQWVNFPSSHSPSIELLAGAINYRDSNRERQVFTYGLGAGWTVAVHEKVDLSLDWRVGHGEKIWSQVAVGVHIKMEKWLQYFADRLRHLGGAALRSVDIFSPKAKEGELANPSQKESESKDNPK